MTAAQVVGRYSIPRRDHRTKSGYQREVSTSRVNKLASDLAVGRVDLPTALLLNLREYDEKQNLVERDGRQYLRVDGESLFVVDGQHRVAALDRLLEKDPERWADFEISFACLLGANEREEMEEFYVVNSTAKSVRTDLALDLLKQRAETDPEVYTALVERGEHWKVEAQAVAEALTQSSLWRGRIRFPGDPKAGTTIGSNGMVSSLKPLLATPYFGSVTRPNRIEILAAFWQGVAEILPEVFTEPADFALQKSTGVQVMHSILISVLEVLRSQGRSVIDAENYADLLRDPLLELEGDTANGAIARGPDFWRSGVDGAAGSFSSNAGRRVLTSRLKQALPAPQVA
jgi:DGQHR domain-containing protein